MLAKVDSPASALDTGQLLIYEPEILRQLMHAESASLSVIANFCSCQKLTHRFHAILPVLVPVFLFVLTVNHGLAAADKSVPNFVIIMADDLGYGDLGCYGGKRSRTPNIDRLAATGMRFTDFHSSGTVCSPTRAGLMTGLYQQRVGVPGVITAAGHREYGLPLTTLTFAEALREAGYATACVGKWHLGYQKKFNPIHHGFDQFHGYVSGNIDFFSHVDQTGVYDWWAEDELVKEEGYTTHLITEHAVNFIQKNRDKPFCLYVAHEAPHYPYQGPNDKAARTVGGSGNKQDKSTDIPKAYQEMVEAMDLGVGRIMDTLKDHNLEQQTLVMFFSDNGANNRGSNGVLRGFKGSVWEGGHRVPCLAYWPGTIEAGQTTNALTITLDIFPTLVELAGIDLGDRVRFDGQSMVPLLTKKHDQEPRQLFWAFGGQQAMRDSSWKLVKNAKGRKSQIALFDLSNDLAEENDLSKDAPERVKKMVTAIRAWQSEVGPNTFRPLTN